jgi:hypothetical protein
MPDISPAPTRMPEMSHTVPAPKADHVPMPKWATDAVYKPPVTLWDRVKSYWTVTKIIAAITPHTFTILRGRIMRNLKTTLTGVVGALASIVAVFGFHVGPEIQTAIVALTVFAIGLFSRDSGNGSDAKP